ncbi:MAG: hypothetical protein FWD53_11375 [Phycisphaerales bacterium]|nr:hypothetical protein [Phycisphaerales bacterium]
MLHVPHETLAVVIVDHGSKNPAANQMLLDVVARFKWGTELPIVEPAHLALTEPTIEQAFARCVAQGATLVVVHPYFLAPGHHSMVSVPEQAATAAEKHGVKYRITKPLGMHDMIVGVIAERVEECL